MKDWAPRHGWSKHKIPEIRPSGNRFRAPKGRLSLARFTFSCGPGKGKTQRLTAAGGRNQKEPRMDANRRKWRKRMGRSILFAFIGVHWRFWKRFSVGKTSSTATAPR